MRVHIDEDNIDNRFSFSTSTVMIERFRAATEAEKEQIDKGIRAAAELLIKSSVEEREEIIQEFLGM